MIKRCAAVLLTLLPGLALAATAAEASPWLGMFKVAFSLGIIVIAIFVVLNFMRRLMVAGLPGGQQPLLRLRGGLMVGQRERVVVIEVQDTWLVVGVTASQMTLLHTLPKGEMPEADERSTLAQQWQVIWNKRKSGASE